MAFYTYKIDVPVIDSNGAGSAVLGIPECLIAALGIVVHDASLSTNTHVKVETALPGANATRTTLYDKTIGHTSQALKPLSGQFMDSSGTAVTSNVWYPPHMGELEVTVSASSGGVPSTTGLTVMLIVQF